MRSTDANEFSSRSHLIFTVRIDKRPRDQQTGKAVIGKLSFIDLAGSEKQKKTDTDKEGLAEAMAIN